MELNITDFIKQHLAELDLCSMVQAEIRAIIYEDVKKEVDRYVKEEGQRLIAEAISEYLSQPVETNDGYGRKEVFPSFDDMFKKHFREKMNSTWEVKSTIEKHVKEHVSKLVNARYNEVIEKVVASLTDSTRPSAPSVPSAPGRKS